MEHDIDGSELIQLIIETQDRKAWGGAVQLHIFYIIVKLRVEVSSFGNNMQLFETPEETEDKKVINVLFCNYTQWGGQPNHYDLVHHIIEETLSRPRYQ
eukprot:12812458-Heterocapsa_arctica.AAC.1